MTGDIAERLAHIRGRMVEAAERAGRRKEDVTLVAVTKTVPPERIRQAYEAGVRVFGENRVQEGVRKIAALSPMPGVAWHLIGHLQSNKVRPAIESFSVIESVDSLKLATRIDSLASLTRRTVPILLEVNVANEASKSGLAPEELVAVFPRLIELTHLRVRGLMTVAPLVADPEEVRPYFRSLRELRDDLSDRFAAVELPDLSMGMSGDYEVAIDEGATMVRIGRALFGERPVQVV